MRMSILGTATTEQVGYGIISFFCVLAPEGMNSIVSGRDKGKRSERFLLARKIYRQKIIFSLLTSSKKKSPLYLSHILNISLEKNDILLQYSGEFIVYNGSWQYHLIIIDSIAETVSE